MNDMPQLGTIAAPDLSTSGTAEPSTASSPALVTAPAAMISVDHQPSPARAADTLVAHAKFELIVKPQDVDPRESQIEYVVQVANPSPVRLRVMSLRAFAPRGATLQDVTDTTLTSQSLRLTKTYRDLSFLLSEQLLQQSSGYREALTRSLKTLIDESFSGFNLFTQLPVKLFSGRLARSMAKLMGTERAWRLEVNGSDQGRRHLETFLLPHAADNKLLCDVFRAKLDEASILEDLLDKERPGAWIADLEPGAIFTQTFLFSCERRLLNPKSYTFSFDCAYQLDGPSQPIRHCTGSVTADISPSPGVLNTIAVVSAFLGACLKFAIGLAKPAQGSAPVTVTLDALKTQIWNLSTIGTVVAALITALLFFNIYDSTEIGRKLKFGSGWRSALLIGGLSGLVTEKVVSALQALLG